jgi:TonB family protein
MNEVARSVKYGLLIVSLMILGACRVNTPGPSHEPVRFAPRLLRPFYAPEYYPDASKRAHETGEVVLRFHIGPDGIARGPFVADAERSTGSPRLIDAAQKVFYRHRFEAGESYRHDVTASVLFEIMPCGRLQATTGLDYYQRLCIDPIKLPEQWPVF